MSFIQGPKLSLDSTESNSAIRQNKTKIKRQKKHKTTFNKKIMRNIALSMNS